MATAIASEKKNGKVTQVIGSTFDVEFPESTLPAIYNAVRIDADHKGVKLELVGEVQQHLGGGKVRWHLAQQMDLLEDKKLLTPVLQLAFPLDLQLSAVSLTCLENRLIMAVK